MKEFLLTCPICKTGEISPTVKKTLGIFKSERFICQKCGSEWKKESENFKLIGSKQDTRFLNQSYPLDDWKNISKKDLTFREEKLVNLASGKIETINPPNTFILEKNEKCYLSENSSLNEPRAVRLYQSGFKGIGIPLGKGMPRIYFGGSEGKSVSEEELKTLDTGILTLTNKRLVFKGNMKTYVTPLQKIINVDAFKDAFRISKSNKQRPEVYYVSDGEIWANTLNGAIKHFN